MQAALAQIGAAFDEAAIVNGFKLRVERLMRLGPQHAAMRARFGARAALLSGRSLDAAIAAVERWRRDERKAFQIASALGRGSGLSLEVLAELRLMLRLMRFKRMEAEFCAIMAALGDETTAIAAE
jgi:ATP phosphoribosyltransferase regulatory subunit HisZ